MSSLGRFAIQPHQRPNENGQALVEFTGACNVLIRACGFVQHPFEFVEIGRRQRPVPAQLVECQPVLVIAQESTRFLAEALEVAGADARRQTHLGQLAQLVDEVGIDHDAPLLRFLFEHQVKPEFTCRWAWEADSTAFWDNRCAQHNPVNDYHGFERVMLRITLKGTKPV
jgi:hypothetical protein